MARGPFFFGWFSQSKLLRNVATVAIGTAAAQVIGFAFSPIITRIYGPEVFGLQGIFLSLIGVFSPIIALRYPMAIVTAEGLRESRSLVRLSILIASANSVVVLVILLIGGQTLLTLLGAADLGALILLLPLALYCVALQDVMDFQATRFGAFRLVGLSAVFHALTTNLARVIGGVGAATAFTFVLITALAPVVRAGFLFLGSRGVQRYSTPFRKQRALALLRKHRDFAIFRMPTDVLNALSQSVPVLLLAALFSPTAAGLYVLARTVLNLPANLIGTAVGNVLYARFAELSRVNDPLPPLLLRSTASLLAFAPLLLGLSWFAPTVFSIVFGDDWREAGRYAQWMALWVSLMIANVPSVRIIPIIGRQRFLLFFNLALLLARVIVVVWAWWWFDSAIFAVAWYSIVSSLIILIGIVWTFILTHNHVNEKSGYRK